MSENQLIFVQDKLKNQVYKLTSENKDLKEQVCIKKVLINNLQIDLAKLKELKASPCQKASSTNKMELINTRQAVEKLKQIVAKYETKEEANLKRA